MSNSNSSAVMTANPLLYAEISRTAYLLWKKYANDLNEMQFTWEDLMQEVLIGLKFDCTQIKLFAYRFKNAVTKERIKAYVYNKYLKEYAYYFDASMPDQEFPDFPVGEDLETCIKFLVKKFERPITCSEAVYHIRKEDYTRYFLKCDGAVKSVMRKLEPSFRKMNDKKSIAARGLNNPKAKMTLSMQSEAQRLVDLWGKKYTAIGKQLGVSKDTVRNYIIGDSYRAYAV
jgi:predicted DNA-binding protein (UPF0251 family)